MYLIFFSFCVKNPYLYFFQLVDRFEVGLKHAELNVNWSQAALFMETTIDFSALFISTDTPGKFRIIPSFAFESKAIFHTTLRKLKPEVKTNHLSMN